jgi:hypothetical protein
MTSSSGLRGHRRTYLTILESADHALLKMVRYVLLRPLRPELDVIQNNCRVRFLGISRYVHFSLATFFKLGSTFFLLLKKLHYVAQARFYVLFLMLMLLFCNTIFATIIANFRVQKLVGNHMERS